MGYRVKAGLFTAEEVGAPHKRERLFILAYAESARARQHKLGSRDQSQRGLQILANTTILQREALDRFEPKRDAAPMGDSNSSGLERRRSCKKQERDTQQTFPPGPEDETGWKCFLEYSPNLEPSVCRGADGLAHRVDRLRLCGNGVVPLVAAYAFCTLSTEAIKRT